MKHEGILRSGSIVLLLSISFSCFVSGQSPSSSPKIILQVINKHCTMGRTIPSLYLRVFSNGTVECHKVKYASDDADLVRTKTLTTEEVGNLVTLLASPELAQGKRRYESMYQIIDSWMEWDIKVPHGSHSQAIQVLNFDPLAAEENNRPYPDALLQLGCSIRKLRTDVYGDEPSRHSEECKQALKVE
jgi:hypothetical protein